MTVFVWTKGNGKGYVLSYTAKLEFGYLEKARVNNVAQKNTKLQVTGSEALD